MVSTRQMTTGTAGTSQSGDYVPVRLTRHNASPVDAPDNPSADTERRSDMLAVSSPPADFMQLPQEILEKILNYLPFKNVCQLRLVNRSFDMICGQLLNSTFQKLQNQMLNRFQLIKRRMPRRESARRNHHLACESDIIETLHMRLQLLQMSFGKHIERKHCCFFPGDILDEVYNILHYIKVTPKLVRPYKVTDELFDLSTMAMEYFKDRIEPDLPEIAYFGTDFLDFTGTFPPSGSNKYALDSSPLGPEEESKETDRQNNDILECCEEPLPQSNMVLRKRIRRIKQGMKKYNNQLSLLKQDLRTCKRKTAEQQKQISEQQKQLAEQQKQTLEYATRLDEYDKKNEEISRKFSTLLQELNKCKTELQYWRSKSPATPPFCTGCGTVMTAPPEEFEALINQGVMPEDLVDPTSDFVPIPRNALDKLNEIDEFEVTESACQQLETPVVSKSTKRKLDHAKEGDASSVAAASPTAAPCTSPGLKSRRVTKNRSKRVKL